MNTEMKIPLLCKKSPVGVYVVVYKGKLDIKGHYEGKLEYILNYG